MKCLWVGEHDVSRLFSTVEKKLYMYAQTSIYIERDDKSYRTKHKHDESE